MSSPSSYGPGNVCGPQIPNHYKGSERPGRPPSLCCISGFQCAGLGVNEGPAGELQTEEGTDIMDQSVRCQEH